MHILVFHQFYLKPGQPGGSRFNEFARLWQEAGHEVTVIAGDVDYQTGKGSDSPWPFLKTSEDGVSVYRCRVGRSYAKSYAGRMAAFAEFALTAGLAALHCSPADVVIATSPPLITPLPAYVHAQIRAAGIPWVFEIRDLWPESAVTTGVLRENGILTRALYALEKWAVRSAAHVVVLTPAFREDLRKRGLIAPQWVSEFSNGADLELFKPASKKRLRKKLGWENKFVVLYAGAHGRANAISQMVEAAKLLQNEKDILLVTVGDGAMRPEVEALAQEYGLDNFQCLGAVPKSDMPNYVNACDVGAAVLQDNPTFRTVYPNKVFDYMACKKPTLLAIDGVARTMVVDHAKAGVFCEPENPKAMAACILALKAQPVACQKMGRSGLAWVKANVDRKRIAQDYLELLEDLYRKSEVGRARQAYLLSKRGLDMTAASLALFYALPAWGVCSLGVWATMGRPIHFRQARPGFHGQSFKMMKLRTMKEGLEKDRLRLTAYGRWLRALSLDEIPTLLHVLFGEMSLVGPRPLLEAYLERYSDEQAQRHAVKPGVTGFAQINGRNAISWAQKFAFDRHYVREQSLALDLKILIKTVSKVFTRADISHQSDATMPEFKGNAE